MAKTIAYILQQAKQSLEEKQLDAFAAQRLLEFITEQTQASLLANLRETVTDAQYAQYQTALSELLTGKPLQHITGEEHFYGRVFEVNEHVLIPRPETEELVLGVLMRGQSLFASKEQVAIADIGTGSGAIAISLQKEWPTASVTATDISEKALHVAKSNGRRLGVQIDWKQGDLTKPIADQKWDIIVSNPPYIANEERQEMSKTVVNFEPHNALFAPNDGLYFYEQLAKQLPTLMNQPSIIALEFGYLQGQAVKQLFQQAFPTAVIEVVKDINQKDRMLFCQIS